jgi:exonuclease SbcD
MRIAHLADTHIGYRALPGVTTTYAKNLRTDDTERAFCAAIQQIVAEHKRNPIDLFIHAGDIFDRPRPTFSDMLVVAGAIRELKVAGIPQVWIAGNHDMSRIPLTDTPLTMLRELFQDDSCYLAVERDRTIIHYLDCVIDLQPWDWSPEREPVVHETVKLNTRGESEPYQILVAHGGQDEIDRWSIASGMLPDEVDYIALGHIHYHDWNALALSNAHYPGSTERFGWRDAAAVPGWMLVTLEDGGLDAGERFTVPCRPFIDLGELDGEGMTDGEVIDRVIHELLAPLAGALQPYEALARVCLSGIGKSHHGRLREKLAATAARFTLCAHLQVDFLTAGYRYVAPTDYQSESFDVIELFKAFVDQMDDDLSGFVDRFRDAGLKALDRARELEQAETAGRVD